MSESVPTVPIMGASWVHIMGASRVTTRTSPGYDVHCSCHLTHVVVTHSGITHSNRLPASGC